MKSNNVLLLFKKTSYSIYFENSKSSLKHLNAVPREIARFKSTHDKHFECLNVVENILKSSNVSYTKASRGKVIDYSRYDLIITVGGDGTFLEAARSSKNQIILGVNSDPSWSVGRFCAAQKETFENIFQQYMAGRAIVREFPRIKLCVNNHQVNVLNDILVCHHNPAAMSRYYLSVGASREEQKSSGVWIATSAGSSGAIKSAGGNQFDPENSSIQYKPRELYSGRKSIKYKLCGGIVLSNVKIKVTSLMREGFVFVDGSHLSFPFDFGETLEVSYSKYPLKLVAPK